jgi:hypothetical protein
VDTVTTDTCLVCGRLKRLDGLGLVVAHMLSIDVSRRAITTVGVGRVRRRCGGSGRPPRRRRGAPERRGT